MGGDEPVVVHLEISGQVPWPVRRWHKRLGLTVPAAWGFTGPRSAAWVALLVPHWARWVHHAYAAWYHFYWLPCPVCGVPSGGHEGGTTIPTAEDGHGLVICSACTRAGFGERR